MESLVVTVVGPDKPGLVERIAVLVEEHKGSWVESRMARLAGQFAGVVRVHVPSEARSDLHVALDELSSGELRVHVVRGGIDAPDELGVCKLTLVGSDRPGIVRNVTSVLTRLGVNVDELHTELDGAPWSGDALFRATAKLRLPEGLELTEVETQLEAIATDLMVDIDLG